MNPFESVVLDEPPLRTTADQLLARGKNQRRRRHVLGATLASSLVLAVAASSAVLLGGGGGTASVRYAGQPTAPASPQPTPLSYQEPASATRLNCAAGISREQFEREGGFTAAFSFLTGDPVADCERVYREQTGHTPALRAYGDGHVYVVVVPADWPVPATYRLLPSGFRVDVRRVALGQALGDPVDGADMDCLSDAEAIARARVIVREVGLSNYTVEKYDAAPIADGSDVCARALLPSEGGTRVLVTANEPGPQSTKTPTSSLVDRLRREVAQRCLSAADAAEAAREAAAAAGLAEGEYDLLTVETGGARCTRVDLVVSGAHATIVLRVRR